MTIGLLAACGGTGKQEDETPSTSTQTQTDETDSSSEETDADDKESEEDVAEENLTAYDY